MCLDGKLLSGIREIAVQHVASELNWMTLPYKGKAKKGLTTSLSAGSKDMFVGSSAGTLEKYVSFIIIFLKFRK